ncbi:acyl-CoA dehydrogenase family protein [Advenella alkanexedens]|uniref:Acyl-CoA dehydrogenase family protein n=1 Tax=Advenella alkanexedens TaxID=1481665 RepID=A0ABS6NMY1_9BURK|nr:MULTISPECIES: acyl-CoA dehydrogenase family protein [Advenella]MBV4396988.1 acyl-CoA dehydrogenase family protein [Advenella alkanexedens]MDD3756680.1 acyl-CoA dehydrogenase family protein [Advenella sp.]
MLDVLDLAYLPQEENQFRGELRAFIKETTQEMDAYARARSWMGFDAGFSKKLAAKGWLGLTLPKQYGGAEKGYFSRFVLSEELLGAGAPVSAHWIADRQSGPLILRYGTEAQKQFYLPKICQGEAFFCIGMSEPDSGSDLASIKTRAQKNDKGWLLNGSKIWTTNAHQSHYMIALVRTSGEAGDRHKGLSQVIIDLSLPGVTVRPIVDVAGDAHFSEVFFTDVQLADDALIGNEGDGWEQVNAELAFERSGPERIYSSMALVECFLKECRQQGWQSERVQVTLGGIVARLAVLRTMSLAITSKLAKGENPSVEASLVKDYGTGLEQDISKLIADCMGGHPEWTPSVELIKTLALVDQVCPSYSLRGGTREILRGIIARGLGLR